VAPDAQAQATLAAPPPLAAAPTLPAVRVSRAASADWQPAEADPPLAPGAVIDGRYQVITVIGEGGMGRVYEIEHLFLRRRLALKLVRRDAGTGEAAARLLQEAVLAGQVSHATVVPVFDCAALPDGQVYVAMELLRGESLEQALLRPLPAAELLRWLAEVARGLAAAHRAGIVHRDVKPANLFLARASDGSVQPRILDFGIAKLLPGLSGEAGAGVQTQAGALLGTPYYMAPERIRGETGDARADLYGLGVILYEALTGEVPFVGEGFMEIVGRHLREPPLDPRQAAPQRQIPDALAELTLALLRKDPAARPDDGEAVADALLAAARDEAVARLTLGAAAPAVPQAVAEEATQQLAGQVAVDASAQTEVLAGQVAVDASARTEVLAAAVADVRGDMSQGTAPASAAGALARTEAWMSSGTGDGREPQDMSSRAGLRGDEDMSAGTAPPLAWLRAAGLLLLCAAAGGLVAWALLRGAGEVEAPPEASAGPPTPAGPSQPPAATASPGPPATPEPANTGSEAVSPGSEAVSLGSAAATEAEEAGPTPTDAAEPQPQAPKQPPAKKRARKPGGKAGTTGQGPRGPGPKIKTDVYDE
jgi:hypothetical protein